MTPKKLMNGIEEVLLGRPATEQEEQMCFASFAVGAAVAARWIIAGADPRQVLRKINGDMDPNHYPDADAAVEALNKAMRS